MELGWDCLERLAEAAVWLDSVKHFLFSGFVGLLVYVPTLITLYVHGRVMHLLTGKRLSTVAGFIIIFCPLLLAFAAALYAHYWLDTFCCAFLNPLNEGLDLVLP